MEKEENTCATPDQFHRIIHIVNKINGQEGREVFDELNNHRQVCHHCRNERLLHYPFNRNGIIPA